MTGMHDNRNKIRAKRRIQRCTLKKPKVAKIRAKTSTMGPSTPLCKLNVNDKVVKNECTVELTDFVTESAKNISMLVSELDYLKKQLSSCTAALEQLAPLNALLKSMDLTQVFDTTPAELGMAGKLVDALATELHLRIQCCKNAVVFNIPDKFPLLHIQRALLEAADLKNVCCKCIRLRKKAITKICPILFQFGSAQDARVFISKQAIIARATPFNTVKITYDRTVLQRRLGASCGLGRKPMRAQSGLTPTVDLDITPPNSPTPVLLDGFDQPTGSDGSLPVRNITNPLTRPAPLARMDSPYVNSLKSHNTFYNSTTDLKNTSGSGTTGSPNLSRAPKEKTISCKKQHCAPQTQRTSSPPRLFTLRQTTPILPTVQLQPAVQRTFKGKKNHNFNSSIPCHLPTADSNYHPAYLAHAYSRPHTFPYGPGPSPDHYICHPARQTLPEPFTYTHAGGAACNVGATNIAPRSFAEAAQSLPLIYGPMAPLGSWQNPVLPCRSSPGFFEGASMFPPPHMTIKPPPLSNREYSPPGTLQQPKYMYPLNHFCDPPTKLPS